MMIAHCHDGLSWINCLGSFFHSGPINERNFCSTIIIEEKKTRKKNHIEKSRLGLDGSRLHMFMGILNSISITLRSNMNRGGGRMVNMWQDFIK